jgi:uncharacterized protein YaaW (UPF0174 family)
MKGNSQLVTPNITRKGMNMLSKAFALVVALLFMLAGIGWIATNILIGIAVLRTLYNGIVG